MNEIKLLRMSDFQYTFEIIKTIFRMTHLHEMSSIFYFDKENYKKTRRKIDFFFLLKKLPATLTGH